MNKGARDARMVGRACRVHPAKLRTASCFIRGGEAVALLAGLWGCGHNAASPSRSEQLGAFAPPSSMSLAVQSEYLHGLDTLEARVAAFARIVDGPATDSAWAPAAQRSFIAARDAYKQVEVLFEFESGATALEINGAAVEHTEENDGIRTSNAPMGFQVVEDALFPSATPSDSASVRFQVQTIHALVLRARALAKAGSLTEMNLFDAVRLEIARVSVLALANADTPVAERGLPEGAAVLRGLRTLLNPVALRAIQIAPTAWAEWDATLRDSEEALRTADPQTIDRIDVTRRLLVPLARHWAAVRVAMGVPLPPDGRPWRAEAASIFDVDAFDAWQFAPAYTRGSSVDSAAALGSALFSDTRLSGDGTRSCGSCHSPALAFTDGRARSLAQNNSTKLRNAPTLLNAALQRAQFADSRAEFLEDQVTDVVQNTHELGGALAAYATRLRADPAMRGRFLRSFSDAGDSTVTPVRVAQALAAYERTLIALNAPFDRYVRGDTAAMTVSARRGYNVFMAKGKCGTCHFAPLFNGTVPPVFARSEMEVIGTPGERGWNGPRADADSGRARIYTAPNYLRAFKTPSVRNSARTAPYMHNGIYRTLDEVVEFYNRGGGAGLGLDVPNQTLPFDRLQLTTREKRDLVAFMESLTDVATRSYSRR